MPSTFAAELLQQARQAQAGERKVAALEEGVDYLSGYSDKSFKTIFFNPGSKFSIPIILFQRFILSCYNVETIPPHNPTFAAFVDLNIFTSIVPLVNRYFADNRLHPTIRIPWPSGFMEDADQTQLRLCQHLLIMATHYFLLSPALEQFILSRHMHNENPPKGFEVTGLEAVKLRDSKKYPEFPKKSPNLYNTPRALHQALANGFACVGMHLHFNSLFYSHACESSGINCLQLANEAYLQSNIHIKLSFSKSLPHTDYDPFNSKIARLRELLEEAEKLGFKPSAEVDKPENRDQKDAIFREEIGEAAYRYSKEATIDVTETAANTAGQSTHAVGMLVHGSSKRKHSPIEDAPRKEVAMSSFSESTGRNSATHTGPMQQNPVKYNSRLPTQRGNHLAQNPQHIESQVAPQDRATQWHQPAESSSSHAGQTASIHHHVGAEQQPGEADIKLEEHGLDMFDMSMDHLEPDGNFDFDKWLKDRHAENPSPTLQHSPESYHLHHDGNHQGASANSEIQLENAPTSGMSSAFYIPTSHQTGTQHVMDRASSYDTVVDHRQAFHEAPYKDYPPPRP